MYSFLIGGDGNVYEGRGWNTQGAHTGGFNTKGYGVCFMGNFMEHSPTEDAIGAYLGLVDCMVEQKKIVQDYQNVTNHRFANSFSCVTVTILTMLNAHCTVTQNNKIKFY